MNIFKYILITTQYRVSGFICEEFGNLSYKDPDTGELINADLIIEYGKNKEDYFDSEQLLVQVKKAHVIARVLYPLDEINLTFIFDQSTIHKRIASNAIVPHEMTLKDGGVNQRLARDTVYIDQNGASHTQKLTTTNAAGVTISRGLLSLCVERGLDVVGKKVCCDNCKLIAGLYDDNDPERTGCCMRRLFFMQPDIEQPGAQNAVADYFDTLEYCDVVFLPKYHCELNPIERKWSFVKNQCRDDCDYTLQSMRINVPKYLNEMPKVLVRKHYMSCNRAALAYAEGLTGPLNTYVTKKYSSHRRIPKELLDELENLIAAEGGSVPFKKLQNVVDNAVLNMKCTKKSDPNYILGENRRGYDIAEVKPKPTLVSSEYKLSLEFAEENEEALALERQGKPKAKRKVRIKTTKSKKNALTSSAAVSGEVQHGAVISDKVSTPSSSTQSTIVSLASVNVLAGKPLTSQSVGESLLSQPSTMTNLVPVSGTAAAKKKKRPREKKTVSSSVNSKSIVPCSTLPTIEVVKTSEMLPYMNHVAVNPNVDYDFFDFSSRQHLSAADTEQIGLIKKGTSKAGYIVMSSKYFY